MFDLSIIIVNWNSKEYIRHCIDSILASTFGIRYEIIVIDSASFDGCGDMLQLLYPQVRFIQSEHNVGFARANNIGAKVARGGVLLYLNPDTVVRGQSIQYLYGCLSELPCAGIVACRLLNSDGTLQITSVQPLPTILNQVLDARIFQSWFPQRDIWMSAATFDDATEPVPVEVVSGACMMIRRETFERVGMFSTDYFMYGEDLDLCYKVSEEGFKNYYVPAVEIIHHGGGSTKHKQNRFSSVMMCESVSRLLRKMHGKMYSLGYRLALTVAAITRLALLGLYFSIVLIKGGTSAWRAAFDKWIAILRWGIGLENWVKEYGLSEEVNRRSRGRQQDQWVEY